MSPSSPPTGQLANGLEPETCVKVPTVAARILDPARADFYSGQGFDVVSPTKTAIGELSDRVLASGGA